MILSYPDPSSVQTPSDAPEAKPAPPSIKHDSSCYSSSYCLNYFYTFNGTFRSTGYQIVAWKCRLRRLRGCKSRMGVGVVCNTLVPGLRWNSSFSWYSYKLCKKRHYGFLDRKATCHYEIWRQCKLVKHF